MSLFSREMEKLKPSPILARAKSVFVAAMTVVSFTASASAQTVQINETTHVRYTSFGNGSVNANYFVGTSGSGFFDTGFVFSTAGAKQASSIAITFNPNGVFRTDVGFETLSLFDFTGNLTTLANGTGGTTAYIDLNSGNALGSYTLTAADLSSMPSITIQLSQSFVDQFNASIGSSDQRVALGASDSTISGTTTQGFWGSSGSGSASFLTVTAAVPEPATWSLMILGFGVTGAVLRRRERPEKSCSLPILAA